MPIAKKKDIPQDFLNQMKLNLTKTDSSVVEDKAEVHMPEPLLFKKQLENLHPYRAALKVQLLKQKKKNMQMY